MQNTERFAQKLKDSGVWVTTRYYEGFGHMEPVIAMGSLWRWRMPVLDDMVAFFQMFGAFPSGVPYVAVAPDPPEQLPECDRADGADHRADECDVPADRAVEPAIGDAARSFRDACATDETELRSRMTRGFDADRELD